MRATLHLSSEGWHLLVLTAGHSCQMYMSQIVQVTANVKSSVPHKLAKNKFLSRPYFLTEEYVCPETLFLSYV